VFWRPAALDAGPSRGLPAQYHTGSWIITANLGREERQGELPAPRHDLSTGVVAGVDCSKYRAATGGDYNAHGDYDVNGDGVFNVLDYACDSRVAAVVNGPGTLHDLRHGPGGRDPILVPEA
jgi:hypothetical protein